MKTLIRLCLLVIILISACSPVKQVLKNQRYFQEVADSVVKRGYCINDTVLVHDTMVEERTVDRPTYIHDTVRANGLVSVLHFDTTLSNGTQVTIHQGTIAVSCPQVKQKTVYIKKEAVVRDRKLEQLLYAEIQLCTSNSDSLKQVIKDRDAQIEKVQLRLDVQTTKLYALLILLIAFIGIKIVRFFRIF